MKFNLFFNPTVLLNGQENDEYLDELLNLFEEEDINKSPQVVIHDQENGQNQKSHLQKVQTFEPVEQQQPYQQDLKQTCKIESSQQPKKLKLNLKRSFL